jgi:chaperone modulatory protein CbpM
MSNHIEAGADDAELQLLLGELARAIGRSSDWVIERVEAGQLQYSAAGSGTWRFCSADLKRARRLAEAEHLFDANADAAAMMVDLIEEVCRLRQQLLFEQGRADTL